MIPVQWSTCTTLIPVSMQVSGQPAENAVKFARFESAHFGAHFAQTENSSDNKGFQRLSEILLCFTQLCSDLCRGQMVTLAPGDNKKPGETVLQCAIT